jgi:hypothetical protein
MLLRLEAATQRVLHLKGHIETPRRKYWNALQPRARLRTVDEIRKGKAKRPDVKVDPFVSFAVRASFALFTCADVVGVASGSTSWITTYLKRFESATKRSKSPCSMPTTVQVPPCTCGTDPPAPTTPTHPRFPHRFLITSPTKAVLHTGDLRADAPFMRYLRGHPVLKPFIRDRGGFFDAGSDGKPVHDGGKRRLDRIYLDTGML